MAGSDSTLPVVDDGDTNSVAPGASTPVPAFAATLNPSSAPSSPAAVPVVAVVSPATPAAPSVASAALPVVVPVVPVVPAASSLAALASPVLSPASPASSRRGPVVSSPAGSPTLFVSSESSSEEDMYSDSEEDRAARKGRKKEKEEKKGKEKEKEKDAGRARPRRRSGDDSGWHHRHLQRECCLRCAKRLGREAVLECVFPPTHTKCTRCTRLKDKCLPVPPSVAAAVVEMVNNHYDYNVATGAAKVALRARVVAAANALPADIRVAASVAPSPAETNAALLRGQEATLSALLRIEALLAGQAKEKETEKEKEGGRKRKRG
ncbi:hypothetical protein VE03_10913 [Pseudogymnoascus sp. 23342-1-I1]|nr:hypothetical protein VE03_10913 [Pseudogymnoascus sp. 23342-1-I1]